jgi:hypothetical protein
MTTQAVVEKKVISNSSNEVDDVIVDDVILKGLLI